MGRSVGQTAKLAISAEVRCLPIVKFGSEGLKTNLKNRVSGKNQDFDISELCGGWEIQCYGILLKDRVSLNRYLGLQWIFVLHILYREKRPGKA